MQLIRVRTILLVGGILGAFALQAFAQEGTILGTVTDPSNAPVPNATITIKNNDTGLVTKLTTNAVGQYVAPAMHIGRYSVQAEATGFKPIETTGLVLTVADRLRADFKLELGSTRQSITVEASAIVVQTETGAVSNMITGQQIGELGTNGHTFYTLLNLVPGVSSQMSSYQMAVPTGAASANVNVNGQRMSHNIWLLDGGEANDRGGGGNSSVLPSQESLAEFRALVSNYSAKYGLSSGATMTMVLKAGTNRFHGEAWEFFRNDWLDAIKYPNLRENPKLRQNLFGFNVAGPVALHESGEHKTFFFYNMEWRKYINAGGELHTGVPTPSIYANLGSGAVFPSSLTTTQLHTPCVQNLSAAQQSRFTGAGLTLSDCATQTFYAFPSNTIPASLIDSNAQALLGAGIFGPTSGLTTGTHPEVNFIVAAPSVPTSLREEIGRVDHNFSDKFSVFGHFLIEDATQNLATSMWSGDNVPTIGTNFKNPAYSAVVHATHTISPTLLNEIAFNYNGNRIHILPNGIYKQPSGYQEYRVFTGPNEENRIPAINLGGVTGTNYTSNWMPWNNAADDYQIRDDVSWVKGSHQLKFGASWAIYKKIQDLFANTEGNYTFNGFFTGSDFADFLLGTSSGYTEDAVKDAGHWNNVSWAAYIEDDWRVSRRLNLNLGLRWDGIPHTYEANNRMSNFYANMWNSSCVGANFFNPDGTINKTGPAASCLGTSPNSILAGYQFYLNGVGISGQPGVPHGMVQDAWWNWGPRIGFAYDITGNGKTVLRGGFGAMYERIQGNDMYNGGTNVPFSAHYGTDYVSLSDATTNVKTGAQFTPASAPVLVTGFGRTLLSNGYQPPVSYQYSIGVERQLNPKLVLSAAYVGTQTRHQNFQAEYNLPPESDLPGLLTGTLNFNEVVPYRGFRDIPMVENSANGHYNSLQINLRGQATSDLSLQFAYTLSRATDTNMTGSSGGDLGVLYNPYDWRYNMGPSQFDRHHVAVTSFVYSLPFLRHSPSRALRTGLGGWEVSGILMMQTGLPLNITLGGANGNNGVKTAATNLPDFTGNVSYPKTNASWFNTSGFSAPALGKWGNFPINSVYGPGYSGLDLALLKTFEISEARGSHIEFRLEAFNAFNHVNPNYNGVSTTWTSTDFGAITGYATQRNLELALKVVF